MANFNLSEQQNLSSEEYNINLGITINISSYSVLLDNNVVATTIQDVNEDFMYIITAHEKDITIVTKKDSNYTTYNEFNTPFGNDTINTDISV